MKFKKTDNPFYDIYIFLEENIGTKFSKKELIEISGYDNTAVRTALKNLDKRHMIVKNMNFERVPNEFQYMRTDVCSKIDEED